jgi:hypothetical protein
MLERFADHSPSEMHAPAYDAIVAGMTEKCKKLAADSPG